MLFKTILKQTHNATQMLAYIFCSYMYLNNFHW